MTIDDVLKLVRPHLLALQPYSSARDEFDQSVVAQEKFVFLDANENPFETGHNRYPDPHQRELKTRISEIKGVAANKIFLGNGSDEAIDLVVRLFCDSSNNILITTPTYGMYKVSAEINNVQLKTVLLDSNFGLTDDFLAATDSNTKVIFLCSPNNPSGNLLDTRALENILNKFKGIVVIDEAYIDFTGLPAGEAGQPGWLKRLDQYPNLIVLQTFSKAWGLAGLRLGMAFANPQIISLLDKIKPPYNISSATQRLAAQALADISYMERSVKTILAERTRLASELGKLRTVTKVFPSDANFILIRINNAAKVYNELVWQHVVVRDRSQVRRCEDCLRITVGTAEENDILLNALKSL